jgi:hypothetical protein
VPTPPTIPPTCGFPAQIEQGNSYNFTEVMQQYPSNLGWTATLYISQGNTAPTPVVGSITNVSQYLFALSTAFTATLLAGNWDWAIYVSNGVGEQFTGRTGSVEVLQTLAGAIPLTKAQSMVAQLQTTLLAVQAQKYAATNFNGQQKQAADIDKLQKAIVYWESRVIKEKEQADAERGVRHNHAVNSRFAPTTGYPYPRFGSGPWI